MALTTILSSFKRVGPGQLYLAPAPTADPGTATVASTTDGYYALFRARGAEWQAPTSGTWGFALTNSDAYVNNQVTGIDSVAKIQNGTLSVDFSNASFVTNFDLLTNNEVFKRNAQGRIYADGQFTNADRIFSNTTVNGVLTNEKGGSAAYTFQSRLDESDRFR